MLAAPQHSEPEHPTDPFDESTRPERHDAKPSRFRYLRSFDGPSGDLSARAKDFFRGHCDCSNADHRRDAETSNHGDGMPDA